MEPAKILFQASDDQRLVSLAFIGRICPEKRPDCAIEIARRAGLPLAIVAKVDRADRSYYRTRIKPLLKGSMIEFIGELGDSDKGAFLGNAMALLFPIDWPEPFGLVLIEAMANGTPVIAFGRGPSKLGSGALEKATARLAMLTSGQPHK